MLKIENESILKQEYFFNLVVFLIKAMRETECNGFNI